MAIQIAGLTGPQVNNDGATPPVRVDRQGALVVSENAPRYYELGFRGLTFMASTQAGIAVTALATTATGFILSNPAGSGKNLAIIDLIFAQSSVAGATQPVVALAANVNPIAVATVHTTPLTIQPSLLGSTATAVAKADSAATLPIAPVIVRTIWGQSNTATATGG